LPELLLAQPTPATIAVETVTVTSSKLGGADVQSIPIAITALSQEQLTERQIAGGPDLVKQVPNLTFTKTNFTGYNLQIRGIGTQAVSVTIDPAVAVAFNDTPFLRNHFFEQEFYDVAQVEVLRGPQGTLFGRNANAGVVNLVSAKPADQFEAMLSADLGNFHNRRIEGMLNIPIVNDKLALRVAGEWTKRNGYAFNEVNGQQIDGRDLWSTRTTLRWKPSSDFTADLIWEHFQEDDDRLRSGKQLCHNDPGHAAFARANGAVVNVPDPHETVYSVSQANFSQGCLPGSLYDKGDPAHGDHGAFGVPNGFSLPFVTGLAFGGLLTGGLDPYATDHQSTNLRNIESTVPSEYKAKNDTLELNAQWRLTPLLTFDSQTGYNRDFLWSLEDFNRFETSPGIFVANRVINTFQHPPYQITDADGVFCDPQLGCSNRLVSEDLSTEDAWQFSQEFRLTSALEGPFNFSAGGNYLHYETEDKFYVFSNAFTLIAFAGNRCESEWAPGVTDALHCLRNGRQYSTTDTGGVPTQYPTYVDPNPFESLNDNGHNYFLSKNPYVLNSYAMFGEAYYQLTEDLKLTGGLRWTDDQKHFPLFPSRALNTGNYGIQRQGEIDQSWKKFSGRAVVNWTPKLDFTDQTLVYASFSHGYKAGGANPPPAVLSANQGIAFPLHPRTFEPEYINAYELGTKNTAFGGKLELNGDVFFYDYKAYQISQLVDRTSVNINVDATVRGAELSATYSPLPGLKFTFNGGYEDTNINDNQYFIDLMDRTYGHHDTWTVFKPWAGEASNCVFPNYVAAEFVQVYGGGGQGNPVTQACGLAYSNTVGVGNTGHPQLDPVTGNPYVHNPAISDYKSGGAGSAGIYPGFDPLAGTPNDPYTGQNIANGIDYGPVPNNGQGFQKPIGGNELPNAPHFTVSLTGEYTMPVSESWAVTLHSDFYWQSDSFARIFNDRPYDQIHGYTNVNAALILSDVSGWQIMGYVKNVFDTTAITGDFLYTDDVGLTTNLFLTDPRLFGVRVTKHFDGTDGDGGGFSLFSGEEGSKPQVWLTLGGNFINALSARNEPFAFDYTRPGGADLGGVSVSGSGIIGNAPPGTMSVAQLLLEDGFPSPAALQKTPDAGFDWEGELAFQPEGSDWVLKAGIRYGRSSKNSFVHKSLPAKTRTEFELFGSTIPCSSVGPSSAALFCQAYDREFIDHHGQQSEEHTILDFTLGRDVGLGSLGNGTISAGVRSAQFKSRAKIDTNTDPDLFFEPEGKYHNVYQFLGSENRTFRGIGPEIALDANTTLLGNPDEGEITFDWGVNAAILFGKQKVNTQHFTSYCHVNGNIGFAYCTPVIDTQTKTVNRSRSVIVPNLGGYIGASVRYSNAKLSLGYRADTFFDAMDGGQEAHADYNRGFYGPYLTVSLGL
jgi:outer membrane receptor protein involved in Fe transport